MPRNKSKSEQRPQVTPESIQGNLHELQRLLQEITTFKEVNSASAIRWEERIQRADSIIKRKWKYYKLDPYKNPNENSEKNTLFNQGKKKEHTIYTVAPDKRNYFTNLRELAVHYFEDTKERLLNADKIEILLRQRISDMQSLSVRLQLESSMNNVRDSIKNSVTSTGFTHEEEQIALKLQESKETIYHANALLELKQDTSETHQEGKSLDSSDSLAIEE